MKDLVRTSQLEAAMSLDPECPLNGAEMHPYLTVPVDWRRPADRRAWTIWWDDHAHFGQVHPRPQPQDVASFYDIDAYYTHAEREQFDDATEARQVGLAGHILRSLAYRFEKGAEPTAEWWRSILPENARYGLEVGCGDGDRMLTYGPFLDAVHGVEPDPRAVRVAHRRGLDVHEGTAENLPEAVKGRRYDLIVFTHVLEHTIDPILSLCNAGALLSDTGVLSIEVPNNASEGALRMGEAWRWLDAPRHLNFFTAESLQACAEAAGLRVRAVLYRGYVRQFTPDWIVDEARISATLDGRRMTQADIRRQLWHSARLLARTALAEPARKYDSVRILCSRA
ncbi:MAG: class I SAM-dependent methyltransferase [Pararhodobacter sp.]|nr:class I SAM-dependent methyltransferase [Pararhodobacter sp.]